MWTDLALMALGALCAGLGGEAFVRGAVRLAAILHVRPALIGVTLAAFATSAPETIVGVGAALRGAPEIALGNALGANVLNLGLALGLSLLIGPSAVGEPRINRDLAAALAVPLLTAALLADGTLGRIDAAALALLFGAWLYRVLRDAHEGAPTAIPMPARRTGEALALLAVGIALLVAAGETFVAGALRLGERQGWDLFVVGATLVALGTTLPELATSITAKLRGQDEVGLGTILGSCVFNGAAIVPAAAFISPPRAAFAEVALTLGAAIVLAIAALPFGRPRLGRARGLVLVALYLGYVVLLLTARPSAV